MRRNDQHSGNGDATALGDPAPRRAAMRRIVTYDRYPGARRRRGSAYVMVLGSSMAVAIIGVTGITALRVERSQTVRSGEFAQARLAAQSAIEIGFREMNQNSAWRTTYTSGTWFSDRKMGSGQCSLSGQDPGDNDLADSNTDNVVLTGVGVAGSAKFAISVTTTAITPPLDALGMMIHAGQMDVQPGRTLTANGAPVSTNGNLQVYATSYVYGDVRAASTSRLQNLIGTVTIPAPSLPMPDAGVLDMYAGKAAPVAYAATISNALLGPGVNTLGAANADGVYFIDASAGDLTLTNVRVSGTLVIRGPGRTVRITGPVFMEPYRSDYPVIITDANLELSMSSGTSLSEATISINLNPLGVPINGIVDVDLVDTYPNEIRGLVHTRGNLSVLNAPKVKGVIIAEGTATVDGSLSVEYDKRLYDSPPQGYTKSPQMVVVDGSWRQVVE